MSDNEWSQETLDKIGLLKQKILMRKIMMDYVIKIYDGWDTWYSRGVMIAVALTFISGVISELMGDEAQAAKISVIITSVVTGGLVKVKDYVGFEKVRDTGKSQTIKYRNLYDRIDHEFMKPTRDRQHEDDFLYWCNREYENIYTQDPELAYTDREEFDKYMLEKGLVLVEDDVENLRKLQGSRKEQHAISICDEKDNTHIVVDPMRLIKKHADADKKERDSLKQALTHTQTTADIDWALERLKEVPK